jgi:hypothetical protein
MGVPVTDEETTFVNANREAVAGENERISLTLASAQGLTLFLF